MCSSAAVLSKKGIVLRSAKYIASFSVDNVDNNERHSYIQKNLENLREFKNSKDVIICISIFGIKIYSFDMNTIFMAHALRRISYSTCDPNYYQFAFVAREPKAENTKQFCHVFGTLSDPLSQELNQIVGRAFKIASMRQEMIREGVQDIDSKIPDLSKEFPNPQPFEEQNNEQKRVPLFEVPPPPDYSPVKKPLQDNFANSSISIDKIDQEMLTSNIIWSKKSTDSSRDSKNLSLFQRIHKAPSKSLRNDLFLRTIMSDECSPVVTLKEFFDTQSKLQKSINNLNANNNTNSQYDTNSIFKSFFPSDQMNRSSVIFENSNDSFLPPIPPIRLNSLQRDSSQTNPEQRMVKSSKSTDNFSPSCLDYPSKGFLSSENSLTPVQVDNNYDIDSNTMNNLEALSSVTWYRTNLTRETALVSLENEEVGHYILRESTTHPGCIALSLRVPDNFSSDNIKLAHYLIQKCAVVPTSLDERKSPLTHLQNDTIPGNESSSTLQFVIKIKGLNKEWASLRDLVFHLTQNQEILPCRLKKPNMTRNINPIYSATNQRTEQPFQNDLMIEEEEEDEDYQRLSDFTSLAAVKNDP